MLNLPTFNVIVAGNTSLPLSLPSATAFWTALSIASCEFTPTVFRNLRMLMLSASSFTFCPPMSCIGGNESLPALVIVDQPIRRRVVAGDGRARRQLGQDAVGEGLAELHPPLVEGVDAPDHALH